MTSPIALLLLNLQQEEALLRTFVTLLHEEEDALSDVQSDDLRWERIEATADEKSRRGESLMESAATRGRLLTMLGFDATFRGMEAACCLHAELGQVWQRIKQCAYAAKTQNDKNGVLVHAHLAETRKSLVALQNLASTATGYDARGRSKGVSSHRTIVAG
jgi:flagellar biosynthesis/type III secretory pathway chaperone